MRARGRGQIAIVGSLSSYRGMPGAGAYGPTKAAVLALAEGLKFVGDRRGVTVQVINPGFVRTPLMAGITRPLPFLMEADEAARRISAGLERGGFEIRFPRRLAWPARAITRLPYPVYFWLIKRLART
jgi:NAD(P)-dependent dehydrogenase (short-subunit alcohol dehydrogenase family)